MHINFPSQGEQRVWITWGEHELTWGEWHSAVLGASLGFLFGERGVAYNHISSEPWYFIGCGVLSYILGRIIHSRFRGGD